MQIDPFALERWFAEVEHGADVMLAESGVRPLQASRFDTDPGALGYVIPTAGDPAFRAEVGALHGRSADETVFTCGTQEANLLGFLSLLETHAVVVTPTYGSLTALPQALGVVTEVSLRTPTTETGSPQESTDTPGFADGGWALDPDAVVEAIRPDTDLVVINNPNNPTGRYHDEASMRAIYDACEDRDAYLLVDEVYRLLAEDPRPPVTSYGPYGVSTGGVSKSFGLAGLRFGWLCGSERVVTAAERWKDYTTISSPIVGQHVARQAIDRRETILAENRELVAEHRAVVSAFLDEHGLAWSDPDCGVNALVEVPDAFVDGAALCRRLVDEESVVLAPGEAFDAPGWVRIGFGLHREALDEGLARLGSFLDRHR